MTESCRDVLDRLVEAATGSLPPPQREGIAAHLAACPHCRREAAEIEAMVAQLRRARFAAPPGFWGDFTDRLHARIAHERRPIWARLRQWGTSPRRGWAAAAVTAAVALAVALGPRLTPTPAPADPLRDRARTIVTDAMATTLPSLVEMLETMRDGLSAEVEFVTDRGTP
jgi:anti-sigma factor RsiW